jgi:hypothetical protein
MKEEVPHTSFPYDLAGRMVIPASQPGGDWDLWNYERERESGSSDIASLLQEIVVA